ncbi:MAG: hypothetical protein AB7O97_08205 [Planctomycetota bacterium]
MPAEPFDPGPHCPLRSDEADIVRLVLDALAYDPRHADIATAIRVQAENLDRFGDLLARYPSPLQEQRLGERRRGLDTLVTALCQTDRVGFGLRAPTQSIVGRALCTAQINFFRLLWHACGLLGAHPEAGLLRERTARLLRTSVYTQLVEEVLSELATDVALSQRLRARAVHQLAHLWAHRLTWRVNEFFPVLEATWEARSKVRVIGGSMLGTSELFQLLTQGGDAEFVDLLTSREHAEEEVRAFREFLFDRSYEDLERLVDRMARENRSSIELDSLVHGPDDGHRDAGSIFYEFFQARLLQSTARRLARLPGPKHTAEGYVLLAWLEGLEE